MDIMLVSNEAYFKPTIVLVNSIIQNNKWCKVRFHLLYTNLLDESAEFFKNFINNNNNEAYLYKINRKDISYNVAPEFFLKVFGIYFLKDIDKVLFLDSDMIVDGSLEELWNTDFNGKYILGTLYPSRQENYTVELNRKNKKIKKVMSGFPENIPIFSAGTMLMDLKKLRNSRTIESIKHFIVNNRYIFILEEALITAIWKNNIGPLDYKYNHISAVSLRRAGSPPSPNTVIYHYPGKMRAWSDIDPDTKLLWNYQRNMDIYAKYANIQGLEDFYEKVLLNKSIFEKQVLAHQNKADNPLAAKMIREYMENYRKDMYIQLLNIWMYSKLQGLDIADYFTEKGYKRIGVYGAGALGEFFIMDISGKTEIAYIVDKYSELDALRGYKVITPENISDEAEVDAIIVTPVYSFFEIMDELRNQGVKIDIISLKEVILWTAFPSGMEESLISVMLY